MKLLLSILNYDNHKWLTFRDLKVTAIILRHQGGYAKFLSFLRLWDSRLGALWQESLPPREEFTPGSYGVKLQPPAEVHLPPYFHNSLFFQFSFHHSMKALVIGTDLPPTLSNKRVVKNFLGNSSLTVTKVLLRKW